MSRLDRMLIKPQYYTSVHFIQGVYKKKLEGYFWRSKIWCVSSTFKSFDISFSAAHMLTGFTTGRRRDSRIQARKNLWCQPWLPRLVVAYLYFPALVHSSSCSSSSSIPLINTIFIINTLTTSSLKDLYALRSCRRPRRRPKAQNLTTSHSRPLDHRNVPWR